MEKHSLPLTCRGWPAQNARWLLKPTTGELRRACTFSCAPNRKFPRQDESLETAITISVNGEPRSAQAGANVADLLRELGLDGGRVAIERNLEILPRPQWAQTLVERGDRYEIVQFVGGGVWEAPHHPPEPRPLSPFPPSPPSLWPFCASWVGFACVPRGP